jgi:predicted aspartyl protease
VRKILVAGLVNLAVLPSAAAAGPVDPVVPLAIDARGGVAVAVRVNDAGPFTFILDTGASRSIVSDDLAGELGAPVVAQSEVVTSAGSEMRVVVRLASITLASARVNALLAPVLPAARLRRLGRGVRGLLGQDFLSAFNYTLDYRRRRLTWDEPLTCDRPGAVRMAAVEGRFVLVADADHAGRVRLVPDSGAEVAVLFGGGGAGPRLSEFRVGGVTLVDVPVAVVDREEPDVDGLLPLHRFRAVSFAAGGSCLLVRQ